MKKPKIRLTMRQRRSVTGLLFVLPFVIGLLLFILRPMITSIQMSFSKVNLNGAAGGFSMEFVGWANFLQALTIDKDFNRLLTESVRDTLIDGVCIIIFSLIIAVILNRKFPGRGAVRAIFFMPVILASGVVLGMEKSNMLLQGIQDLQSASTNTTITTTVQELLLGAFGNTAGELISLIMNIINHFYDIVVASSIQTVIFLSALQTINPSIYEAAEMEGWVQESYLDGMADEIGYVMLPAGPKGHVCTNMSPTPICIPACIGQENAEKAAVIINTWYDTRKNIPGAAEMNITFRDDYYSNYADSRAVDETITSMITDAACQIYDSYPLIPGYEYYGYLVEVANQSATAAQKIEALRPVNQAAIDAANALFGKTSN